ncbi:hypothetical protein M885DRAFT_609064 [Pelagophyceae sp. CCMP2097]|nr:hypothetical protein M885DRAFT_609064 [Pelagophyceae sp. CCMP2097]
MCGYCATFAPTWQRFVDEATRLEARRVNIDAEDGSDLARRLGVLDHGIPAVLLFGVEGSDDYTVLMAGDVSPLSRLVKVAHKVNSWLLSPLQLCRQIATLDLGDARPLDGRAGVLCQSGGGAIAALPTAD